MARLDEVINRGLIELELKGKSKGEVIEELTDLLDRQHRLRCRPEFIVKVYEREAIISTYCGSEVAIPHAVSSAVEAPAVCFGRSDGLHWNGPDEWVRFVFLLAVPEERSHADQLALLSAVAKCCLDPEIRAVWLRATTAEQILESLHRSVAAAEPDDRSASRELQSS